MQGLAHLFTRLRRRVRMPVRYQYQTTECGLAVLRIFLVHFGRDVPTAELRRLTGVTRDCLNVTDMHRAAAAVGVECRGRSMEPRSLEKLKLPVAVHMHFIHFVVLEQITSDTYHVLCPLSGRLAIPREQFDHAFTGIVLEFEPTAAFERGAVVHPARVLLPDLARRHAGLVATVIGLALLDLGLWIAVAASLAYGAGAQALALIAAAGAATVLRQLRQERLATEIRDDLTGRLTHRLPRLPGAFYRYRAPDDLRATFQSCSSIAALIAHRLMPLALNALTVAGLGVAAALIVPATGWILLVAALAMSILVVVASHYGRDGERNALQGAGGVVATLFAAVRWPERVRFGRDVDGFAAIAMGRASQDALVRLRAGAAPHGLDALPVVFIVAVGAALLLLSRTAPLEASVAAILAVVMTFRLAGVRRWRGAIDPLMVSLDKLHDVLLEPLDERPIEAGEPTRTDDAALIVLRFDGVHFADMPVRPEILRGVSFTLSRGEALAITGPSGAGKSTIGALADGSLAATAGQVLVEGREIATWSRADLSRHVARVGRRSFFFTGTVRDNLTLFDTEIDDAALLAALETADAGFVAARVGGLDAEIEIGGRNFSGGQLQRLALARALARKPSILVLDEALDAVDAESEKRIFAALRRTGVAILAIGSRPSTAALCDRVFHCVGGEVTSEPIRVPAAPQTQAATPAVLPFYGPMSSGEALRGTRRQPPLPNAPGTILRRVDLNVSGWHCMALNPLIMFPRSGDAAVLRSPDGRESPPPAGLAGLTARTAAAEVDAACDRPVFHARAVECVPEPPQGATRLMTWVRDAAYRIRRDTAHVALSFAALTTLAGLGLWSALARDGASGLRVGLLLAAAVMVWFASEHLRRRLAASLDQQIAVALVRRLLAVNMARLRDAMAPESIIGALDALVRLPVSVNLVLQRIAVAGLAVAGGVLIAVDGRASLGLLAFSALLALPLPLVVLAQRSLYLEADRLTDRSHRFTFDLFYYVGDLASAALLDRLLGRSTVMAAEANALVRLPWRRRALIEAVRDTLAAMLMAGMVMVDGGLSLSVIAVAFLHFGLRTIEPAVIELIEIAARRRQGQVLLDLPCDEGTIAVDAASAPLALEAVGHGYPGLTGQVLANLDLTIDPAAFTVLHGPSGMGKSTLLHCLLGLISPDHGRIVIGGQPADRIDWQSWRLRVSVIMQGQAIEGNATLRAHVAGYDAVNVAAIWQALSIVEFDREIAHWPMGLQTLVQAVTLSSGEQQRLLIARALAREPDFLILDEAVNAIDEAMLARILARIRSRGIGLLIVSHRASVIAMAERAIRLEHGQIVEDVDQRTILRSAIGGTASAVAPMTGPLPGRGGRHPFRPRMVARYQRPIQSALPLLGPPLPWRIGLAAVALVLLAFLI